MEGRLRPLSEAECYARLYGQRDPTVTVLSADERPLPWPSVSAERLRRAFLARLGLDEEDDACDSEAA
jgi:hypothetical protein